MMTGPFRFAVSGYQAGSRQHPHAHDDLQISVVMRGAVEERVGGWVERAGVLSVVVKDPQVTHADAFGMGGALIARLSVPRAGLADLVEHPDRANAWRWTHDVAAAAPFLRIVERGLAGEPAFAADDDDMADLLAAATARTAAPAGGAGPAWLRGAVQGIHDAWRPGLKVREVARAANVHPVYFARCVRRWHRASAGDLLRRARLRRAAQALASGDTTVSTVAHVLGYSDEPHLCRDFRNATGITPGRLRSLARACERRYSP